MTSTAHYKSHERASKSEQILVIVLLFILLVLSIENAQVISLSMRLTCYLQACSTI